MAERIVRDRLKKAQFSFGDNTVTVRAARYRQKKSESSVTTVFMPGFRVHGNSLAPIRLNKILARESGGPVISLSASSSNASRFSPDQEASAMTAYLQNLHLNAQEYLLAAHSQRTGQAVRVAREMTHDGKSISGVILVSPIELTPHKGPDLAKEILRAAFCDIPRRTAEGIVNGHGGLRKIAEAGAIGATMIKEMARETIVRGPRRHLQHMRQEIQNAHSPVPQDIDIPVVVVLGQHDNVVPLASALKNAQTVFPNAQILIQERFSHHGAIYQEHQTIMRRSLAMLREMRKKRIS